MPRGVRLLAGIAVALLVLPLVGLTLRAPWSRLPELLGRPDALTAMRLSLSTSLAALLLATVLGVPLAWVLARRTFPGRELLRALTVVPMVLPPVVAGVALLLVFGDDGFLGGPIARATGVTLVSTTLGAVLAQAVVAMPFLVVTVEAGLRSMDERLEDVASTLGAGRWVVLTRVSIPLVAPSLLAGMALTWARALGEFGATITFAGNLPGRTRTLPLAVYALLDTDPDAAYLLSLVLLLVSVGVLVLLRGHLLGRRS